MNGRPHEVEDWLGQRAPEKRDQVERLAALVHAAGDGVDEAIRWGRLTFTTHGDWHHWLCAVAVTVRGVNLMFHKGSLLDDPARLLRGEGRYLRQTGYQRAIEAPEEVTGLVREAIAHQTEMLD